MRILFATYSLAFQNPGGGERVLLSLERELKARGHEVTFFDPWIHDVRDFEIIHYFSTWETSFWEHAKRLAPKTPLLVTPAVYVPDTLLNRARSAVGRLRMKAEFSLPDFWLPTSQAEGRGLQQSYGIPADRIGWLPNGVEEVFARGDARLFRERTGIRGPFVLHVGRFHPVKNHLTLIRAIRQAGVEAVFIGDPDFNQKDYFAECEREIAASGGKIHVFRDIAHEDPLLAGAYAATDAFVLPSQFETFGIAALEAAVAGAPLVLSHGMVAREVFNGECAWIDPQNVDEIVSAIQQALKTGRNAVVRERREKLLGQYSWSGIAAKLESIYLTLSKAEKESMHPLISGNPNFIG